MYKPCSFSYTRRRDLECCRPPFPAASGIPRPRHSLVELAKIHAERITLECATRGRHFIATPSADPPVAVLRARGLFYPRKEAPFNELPRPSDPPLLG